MGCAGIVVFGRATTGEVQIHAGSGMSNDCL